MKVYCAWCGAFVREVRACPNIRGDSHGGICEECAKAMLKEVKKRPVLDAGRYRRKEVVIHGISDKHLQSHNA